MIAIRNIDPKRKNRRPWRGAMERLLDLVKRQRGQAPKVDKSPCDLQRKKKGQGKVLQGSLSSAWPLGNEGKGW